VTFADSGDRADPDANLPERASITIKRLVEELQGNEVALGTLLAALKDRGFPLLMILFALPNAVIPGISFLLGTPVLLFSLQLAAGRGEVWLPGFIRRRRLSAPLFARVASRAEGFLIWIERRLRRRWTWLVTGAAERMLGLYIAAVTAFLMMPVPFGNALPALGISFMGAGLIERDGKAVALGMVLGFLGALYIGIAIAIGLEALKALVQLR
jgi:hypothetical protein